MLYNNLYMSAENDFIKIINSKCGNENVLSTKEVSNLTGLHIETLLRMRKKNDGPKFFFIGRKVKYLKADLIEWIRNTQLKYM